MMLLAAWHNLSDGERRARLRCLQGLVRAFVGPAGRELVALLGAAEADPDILPSCDAALADIGTVPLRRLLSVFAATLPTKAEVLESLRAAVSSHETRSGVSALRRSDKITGENR